MDALPSLPVPFDVDVVQNVVVVVQIVSHYSTCRIFRPGNLHVGRHRRTMDDGNHDRSICTLTMDGDYTSVQHVDQRRNNHHQIMIHLVVSHPSMLISPPPNDKRGYRTVQVVNIHSLPSHIGSPRCLIKHFIENNNNNQQQKQKRDIGVRDVLPYTMQNIDSN